MIFFTLHATWLSLPGILALQSLRDFFDFETHLLVQKTFIFANKAKLPFQYVKAGKYQGLTCLVDPALVTILNSKILKWSLNASNKYAVLIISRIWRIYNIKRNDQFHNHDFIGKDLFKDVKKLISYYFYCRSAPYGKNCVLKKIKIK